MNSYARGHELLHKAGEILQTRHIPQSLSGDLEHKAADTALWIRKVLIHPEPDIREVKEPLQNSSISPLFPGHLQGTTVKAEMLHWWAPDQRFKPALLLSLEEDAPQRVKCCYRAAMLFWCHMVLIISLLPRQLQQRHLHAQPLLLQVPRDKPEPTCLPGNTTPGIQRDKCSTIAPLARQGNRCCRQKLTAALQANMGAKKGLLPSSWVVLLIPRFWGPGNLGQCFHQCF